MALPITTISEYPLIKLTLFLLPIPKPTAIGILKYLLACFTYFLISGSNRGGNFN